MHCVEVFPVDEFVRVTFSITPRLINSFSRVLKNRRSVFVGFLNPFGSISMVRKGEARETHKSYHQVFGDVCMVGGVEKQLGDPTAKYVKIREVENIYGSKIERPFGFSYLVSGLDDRSVVLLVTFLADAPPHEASIVEVFEDTEITPDARSSKFNSMVSQRRESHGFKR